MAWEAVLAGLIAGLAGVLATIGHEREERIRERKLDAADDFGTGLLQAMLKVNEAINAATRVGVGVGSDANVVRLRDGQTADFLSPELVDAMAEAQRLNDETHARLARVELLFGVSSPTGRAALEALRALRVAVVVLQGTPTVDLRRANAGFDDAEVEQERFSREALADIRYRWWRPPSASDSFPWPLVAVVTVVALFVALVLIIDR